MPIYEYRCAGCETKFDLLRSFSQADAPARCPVCGGDDTKRAISLFASFSKGSDGSTRPVGGSECAGCASGHCGSCGHHH
ncbi:MAG: zinc ribbon domain-containing protein [Chloroflexi bacterium]|nr:zinc ribbon domain-containing protein [Chloroflexota bacterium]